MPDIPSGEQTIGVAVDGAGKKVRNVEVTILQGDGTLATVEMQVVSIADKQGNVLNFGNIESLLDRNGDLLEEILFELRLQNETNEE